MRAWILFTGLLVVLLPSNGLTQHPSTSPPVRLKDVLEADQMLAARGYTLFIQAETHPPHLAALASTWAAVSQTKDGKDTPAVQLPEQQLVIEGKLVLVWVQSRNGSGRMERTEDRLTIRKGTAKPLVHTGVIGHAAISKAEQNKGLHLDPAKVIPTKNIDLYSNVLGKNAFLGIWEIQADQLRICLAPFPQARPTEFKASAGFGRILTIYKRVREDHKGK